MAEGFPAELRFHMAIANIAQVLRQLTAMGTADENTVKYINHFSNNTNTIQSVLKAQVVPLGYRVAFDRLTVEI